MTDGEEKENDEQKETRQIDPVKLSSFKMLFAFDLFIKHDIIFDVKLTP